MTTTSTAYTSYISGALSGTTFTPSTHFTTGGVMVSDTQTGFHPGDSVTLSGSVTGNATYAGFVANPDTDYILIKSTANGVYYLLGASSTAQTYQIDTTDVLACFVAGTRITTASGDCAVERLAVGDLVQVGSGGLRPIVWIGQRRVDCRQHPRPRDVWPVRVSAGAFRPGEPACDMFLSPDHAVFSDGVLIPVKHLINGATIVQHECETVSYYHLELDRHDLILAEGLQCESYLDNGSRSAFANGGGAIQLHPDFSPAERCEAMGEAAGCAPLRIAGAAVARVRAKLQRRAAELGFASQADLTDPAPDPAAVDDPRALLKPDWYLAANPDVAASGTDPHLHYAAHGIVEGRLPCPEPDLIHGLGLVDPASIIRTMPDVVAAGLDPAAHYCQHGWREDRRPNAYFDTAWYRRTHAVPEGMNPLVHYVLFGERQGLAPSVHFAPTWYRQTYGIGDTVCALAHYLQHRRTQHFSPRPDFDVHAYIGEHATTLRPDRDPYAHFLAVGRFAHHRERLAA